MTTKEIKQSLFNIVNNDSSPLQEVQKLSQGENGILKTLLIYEEISKTDITPGDLCKVQHLTSGRIATTLKSLEKKQYIKRINDSKDGRKILVKLTENGKKIAKSILNKINIHVNKIMERLSEQELSEFIRILHLINE